MGGLLLASEELLGSVGRTSLCELDCRKDRRRLPEDELDLFEASAHGFREEEDD